MRNKLILAGALVAGLLSTGFFYANRKPLVVHAQSATGCDATALAGAYGYTMSGTAYDSQYYTYLFTAAGLLTFDGAGNLSGSDTMSEDGTIVKRAITGTYTVNTDCTGSLTLSNSSLTQNFDMVAVNGGKDWNLVETDSGWMLTAVMKQQNLPVATPTTATQ